MAADRLRDRIADQFAYRGDRADIWRAFDLLLDTDAFLNLGYSAWYQPHVVGSSQRRLAEKVATTVAAHLPPRGAGRLLDAGCGRGGPAVHLADRLDVPVVGIDLVPYNLRLARANAARRSETIDFVVGDATALPFSPGSFTACTAVDSLVYLPDRGAAIAALGEVLEPDGVLVSSDLVAGTDLGSEQRRSLTRFADAWDMPPPGTAADYERAVERAGLHLVDRETLTPHSVGRFRKWTTLYLRTLGSPLGELLERFLRRRGLDPSAIETQIRRAHEALPLLDHVLVVAKK